LTHRITQRQLCGVPERGVAAFGTTSHPRTARKRTR
jgi:hypothetical protein